MTDAELANMPAAITNCRKQLPQQGAFALDAGKHVNL